MSAEADTVYKHTHSNGEVREATRDIAYQECTGLAKLSFEQAGLILELYAMGQGIEEQDNQAADEQNKVRETPQEREPEITDTPTIEEEVVSTDAQIEPVATWQAHSRTLQEEANHYQQVIMAEQTAQKDANTVLADEKITEQAKTGSVFNQPTKPKEQAVRPDTPKRNQEKPIHMPEVRTYVMPEIKAKEQATGADLNVAEGLSEDLVTDSELKEETPVNYAHAAIPEFEETEASEPIEVTDSDDTTVLPDLLIQSNEPAAEEHTSIDSLDMLLADQYEAVSEMQEQADGEAVEDLSTMVERIQELEPDVAEAAHCLIDEIIEKTVEIQSLEIQLADSVELSSEKLEQLENLLIELCEVTGIELDEAQVKALARLLVKLPQPSPDQATVNLDKLFSDDGTHEGLSQLISWLKSLKRAIMSALHSLIGKYALQLVTQPVVEEAVAV